MFRFYKNSEWLYVITDDRLPCNNDDELFFAKSKTPNRFWASIIEKAYAKLHGNYYNLNFGFPEDAFNDLTGLPSNRYTMRRSIEAKIPSDLKERLWRKMRQVYLSGFMMSCNNNLTGKMQPLMLDRKPSGLFSCHAYSIEDVYEFGVLKCYLDKEWRDNQTAKAQESTRQEVFQIDGDS